jgi:hypothetical protein
MQIRPKIDDESPAWRGMERAAVTLSQRINKIIRRFTEEEKHAA